MSMSLDGDRRGLLQTGFIPLLAFFLIYVGLGYYFSFATAMPNLPKIVTIILTIMVAATIYFFMRHTAMSMYAARSRSGVSRHAWILLFCILFLFSGYGVISASMLLLEGPTVIRDTVNDAVKSLTSLDATSKDFLRVPVYEEMKARVERERAQLHSEILNPSLGQYCGVGPKAKQVLSQLNNDLPGIAVLAGTDVNHNCNDIAFLNGIARKYDEIIDTGIANAPVTQRNQIKARETLQSAISDSVGTEVKTLEKIQRQIAGLPSFIFNLGLYHESVGWLADAKGLYESSYQNLQSFRPDTPLNIPPVLDISAAQNIASAVQVVNAVWFRRDRLTTYIYIAVALAVDLMVARAASLVILDQLETRQAVRDGSIPNSDVTYLWTNSPSRGDPRSQNEPGER